MARHREPCCCDADVVPDGAIIPISPLRVVVTLRVVVMLGMLRNFLGRPDVAVDLASRPT